MCENGLTRERLQELVSAAHPLRPPARKDDPDDGAASMLRRWDHASLLAPSVVYRRRAVTATEAEQTPDSR